MSDAAPKTRPQLEEPETWVEKYGDLLFRYALSRVREKALAEDLVQETFVAALKSRDSFEGRSSFSSWLVSILKNKIVDQYRARKRRKEEALEHELVQDSASFNVFGIWNSYVPNWARNPQEKLQDEQFLQVVSTCISKLPENHHEVFRLNIDGVGPKDICKALDLSSSNYWVIMHRARLALRECVEKNWYKKQ